MSSSLPILYSFRRCPYAMRARLALYSAKINHEHREVDLKDKPQEMLEISPKGTVPVMQVNGIVLEESLDIMHWALANPPVSQDMKLLITENDTRFKMALDRYKYPGRYPEESDLDYRNQCIQFIAKLEILLAPYLNLDYPSLPDMAIFPFIRQFSMVEPDWFQQQPYPAVKDWLNNFSSSPLFHHVMEKHQVWIPNNSPLLISFCHS